MTFFKKCLSITLILFTINMPAYAATQATASVSTNNVFLGDIFMLTVEVNDTGSDYQIDTSALKDKFTVFLPSKSQKRSYINGDYQGQTSWQVRLQANKLGTFIIPALTIGNVKTQPITIQVKEPGKQQRSAQGDSIFIENTVNESKIYLGQQVILETKIYVSENITNAGVQPPQLNNAEIEEVDPKPQSQIIRNGIRYQVFAYQYKITPSVAEAATIRSPLLTGQTSRRVNQWQGQSAYRSVNVRGNDIPLTVKAVPANFKGDWLVSSDVRLIENNDLHNKTYFVGDPITRSISLQVASIAVDKMPEIKLNYESSLRYYPDKDDLKQGEINGKLYTQRTITHAIIANKSGQLVLPEIRIPWWNSVTDKQEEAVLPAQTLTIKAAATNNSSNQFNSAPQQTLSESVDGESDHVQQHATSASILLWQLSTLILAILFFLLLAYHLYYRQQVSGTVALKSDKTTQRSPYKQLLVALQAANAPAVYQALLTYLQSQHPTVTQLQAIQSTIDWPAEKMQALLDNLTQLELACAGQPHQWDAKALLQVIKQYHQSAANTTSSSLLDINP